MTLATKTPPSKRLSAQKTAKNVKNTKNVDAVKNAVRRKGEVAVDERKKSVVITEKLGKRLRFD